MADWKKSGACGTLRIGRNRYNPHWAAHTLQYNQDNTHTFQLQNQFTRGHNRRTKGGRKILEHLLDWTWSEFQLYTTLEILMPTGAPSLRSTKCSSHSLPRWSFFYHNLQWMGWNFFHPLISKNHNIFVGSKKSSIGSSSSSSSAVLLFWSK